MWKSPGLLSTKGSSSSSKFFLRINIVLLHRDAAHLTVKTPQCFCLCVIYSLTSASQSVHVMTHSRLTCFSSGGFCLFGLCVWVVAMTPDLNWSSHGHRLGGGTDSRQLLSPNLKKTRLHGGSSSGDSSSRRFLQPGSNETVLPPL